MASIAHHYFLPLVATSTAKYFWLPLSAPIVPFFVTAASGSWFFGGLYCALFEVLRWAATWLMFAIRCDGIATRGHPASDYVYCFGNWPADLPANAASNDGGNSIDPDMNSAGAISVGVWFLQRGIICGVAILVGQVVAILRAWLIHSQRTITRDMIVTGSAPAKTVTNEPYSKINHQGETGLVLGRDIEAPLINPFQLEYFEATRVAPWMDLTLGRWPDGLRTFLFCGATQKEQHGIGEEPGDSRSAVEKRDPVTDHINWMWLIVWIMVLLAVELFYEMMPLRQNPYSDEGHFLFYRMLIGPVVLYFLTLTLFFYFGMYWWVIPHRDNAAAYKDQVQHAAYYENMTAEYTTNYLTIVFPVIAHAALVSWIIVPIVGTGQYDDINYANTAAEWVDYAIEARWIEFAVTLGSIGLVVPIWSAVIYWFKSGVNARQRKLNDPKCPNAVTFRQAKDTGDAGQGMVCA